MYNYYYISLPNISELKQKVLVFVGEEKACELSMLDLRDAHSLDTVPGSARYSSAGEADNTGLIEGKASSGLQWVKSHPNDGNNPSRAPGQ